MQTNLSAPSFYDQLCTESNHKVEHKVEYLCESTQ
jgi:hypothetical protein